MRGHEGFVVKFHPHHPILAQEYFGEMVYSSIRPFMNIKDYRTIFRMKSPEWKYEAAHRLMRLVRELYGGRRRDGKSKSYLELPPEAVRAVYFGYRVPAANRDEILKDFC
jgi:hypothetical protein